MLGRLVSFALLVAACRQAPAGQAPHASRSPSDPVAETAPPRPSAAASSSAGEPGNRILNLFDAFGPKVAGTRHAFGFSALVRYEGKTILFDAGSSADVLEQNARALGVDLRQVDFAVASHSHFDHISGFDYLLAVNPKVKIYFPADIYWGAPFDYDASGPDPAAAEGLPEEQRYFSGGPTKFRWSSSGRYWKANVEFVGQNSEIAPGIHLIATRSPYVGYFSRYPSVGGHGQFKGAGDTKLIELPELSLSLGTTEGEVLLVGCSHSLVDVITRETKKHVGRDVHLVLGGFHLLPYGADEIGEIVRRMKLELGVENVAPTHCTGHLGFKLFREAYGEKYHSAGLGASVPFPRAR
jgi:7,8-dihydropterin-6-yl-methyl-4-(beta-D-ribofuranosyl)aminobenzene 5'-phosphate synthase